MIDHKFFNEVIQAHKRAKNAKNKFELLAKEAKESMKAHKITIWENTKGSLLIKSGPRKSFNKELLEEAGIKYDTFCDIKIKESFNVSHK